MLKDASVEAAKITPPCAAVALSLGDWVQITMIAYTFILILDKLFPGCIPGAAKQVGNWIKEKFNGKGK